jgi:hypothetical protein
MKRLYVVLPALVLSLCLITGGSMAAEPYARDSDHDGFPDDLEAATGFNPKINEPLKKSTVGGKCGAIKTDLLKIGRPQNVLVILDISGSMNEPMDASTKMEIAKRIVSRYVDALPSSMKMAFVIYGKADCGEDSIELVAPMGRLNKSALKARIAALAPRGSTPIANTLNRTGEFFKGFEKDNNNLILISDGMESCGGDPVKSILDLKESEANPEVTVIGLGVNQATRQQLARIAASSDGVYEDVKSEKDFINAFAQFFNKMNKFYKEIVCIVSQYNAYLTYETDQYNKSKSYLVKAATKSFDDGVKAAIKAVEERLDENHAERINAKEKLNEMIQNKMEEMEAAINKFVGKE